MGYIISWIGFKNNVLSTIIKPSFLSKYYKGSNLNAMVLLKFCIYNPKYFL